MDVQWAGVTISKGAVSFGGAKKTGKSSSGYSPASFIDGMEKMCKEMGVDYGIDFDGLRSMMEDLAKIRESNKKAAEKLESQIIGMKKKIVQNMIKTIRSLSSTTYSKESWKKSMALVSKAVKIYTAEDVSSGKLDECLRHLRSAMSKLEPAKKKSEERGEDYERRKALKKYDEAEGEMMAEEAQAMAVSAEGVSIDVSIDASAEQAVLSEAVISETV